MTSLSRYIDDINSLASQLQKLLKVIRHSDPSAEELKHLLHEKYQDHLSSIAREAKERFSWEEFCKFLRSQTTPDRSDVLGENSAVIQKKLISDFEKRFVARQVLNEFSPPDPEEIRRQRELRRRRKEYRARQAEAEKQFSKEQIIEMVQTTRKQRQARSELQSLIQAIRKIDPQKIESKISQSIKPEDLS